MAPRVAPKLVIAIGNPSRGDDALGPMFLDRIAALALPDVELITDFQFQVEHALDLVGRDEVTLVDADAAGTPPFRYTMVSPSADRSITTHALSPAALLDTYRRASPKSGQEPVAYLTSPQKISRLPSAGEVFTTIA